MGTKYITSSNNTYKVFTALLTQSGGSSPANLGSADVIKGVTYSFDGGADYDFSNVGGPIYPDNYSFIATETAQPNDLGTSEWIYNTGAPVATVLENTIGNIWFTYNVVGGYSIYSNGLFTENKTTFSIILMGDDLANGYLCKGYIQEPNSCGIVTGDISAYYDSVLNWKTPIEIRVYN